MKHAGTAKTPTKVAEYGPFVRAWLKARGFTLVGFYHKVVRDWVFKLTSMLAYNLMIALFPLLIVMLALVGVVHRAIGPANQDVFMRYVHKLLPLNIGEVASSAAFERLQSGGSGWIFVGVLVAAIYSGSRLFACIEDASCIIFRLKSRPFLQKNLTAIGMALLFSVLLPLVIALTVLPQEWLHIPEHLGNSDLAGTIARLVQFVSGAVAASVLFAIILRVEPHGSIRWREIAPGALAAGVLLAIYEQIFPAWATQWLHPNNYGALVGFILVLLFFFYYFAFILLLGMEINSWLAGQRPSAGNLTALMHAVQVEHTTRGAAGPTAGYPTENIEEHNDHSGKRNTTPTSKRQQRRHKRS